MKVMAVTLFNVPEWGNVNLIEFIWTLTGCVTIVVCGVQLKRAQERIRLLAASGRNGPMKVLAHAYRRRETLRLFTGIAITGLGIYSTTQPQLPFITITGVLVTVVLFIVAVSAVTQSMLDARVAKNVTEMLQSEIYKDWPK